MPIKGLFNHEENNDDEINKLLKRVKTLELKTNALDVQTRLLAKLENARRSESFSTKQNKDQSEKEKAPRKIEKKTTEKRETFPDFQKQLYSQLATYVSKKITPIHQEIDNLENRISAMEKNIVVMKELLEESLHQTMQLKDEMEKMRTEPPTSNAEKPIVIRELKVDRIMLDKYEQNNNFGSLGIKEISGQLNIGATFGGSAIPTGIADEVLADAQNLDHESGTESVNDSSDDFNQHSHDEPQGASGVESSHNTQQYGRGNSGYFEGQQPSDEEDSDFTDISIE